MYLAIGFLIAFGLFGWEVVSTVRREGFGAVGNALRIYIEELPLYWRVPVVAWTFVIALPLIATWATLKRRVRCSRCGLRVLVVDALCRIVAVALPRQGAGTCCVASTSPLSRSDVTTPILLEPFPEPSHFALVLALDVQKCVYGLTQNRDDFGGRSLRQLLVKALVPRPLVERRIGRPGVR